jgi:hypothetical protein
MADVSPAECDLFGTQMPSTGLGAGWTYYPSGSGTNDITQVLDAQHYPTSYCYVKQAATAPAPTPAPTAAPTPAPATTTMQASTLPLSGLSVAGVGGWWGQPGRKDINGNGYYFHPENMLYGWTNGGYGNAWLGADSKDVSISWCVYDLNEPTMIQAISLRPSQDAIGTSFTYATSEYEILVSNSAPPASGSFASAAIGFTQVAHQTVGSVSDTYTNTIGQEARYLMIHCLSFPDDSLSWGISNMQIYEGTTTEASTWTGPFDTDIPGTGMGGTSEATLAQCEDRCVATAGCQAIQFSASETYGGYNCFCFSTQADTASKFLTFQIFKLTQPEALD